MGARLLPLLILLMAYFVMPYSSANSRSLDPSGSFLNSSACKFVILDRACLSPRPGLFTALPLEIISRILTRSVPANRWEGLTHDGLSQVWQIRISSGRYPFAIKNDTRWDRRCLLPMVTFPYPSLSFDRFQIQQSSEPSRDTLSQNLASCFSVSVIDGTTECTVLSMFSSIDRAFAMFRNERQAGARFLFTS